MVPEARNSFFERGALLGIGTTALILTVGVAFNWMRLRAAALAEPTLLR